VLLSLDGFILKGEARACPERRRMGEGEIKRLPLTLNLSHRGREDYYPNRRK